MKLTAMVAVAVGALALAGSAGAIDIGSSVKSTVKGGAEAGGKMAVEKQINDRLAKMQCSFKGKTTDTTCNLNNVVAELKAQHTVAEKSGFGDFDINVTAYGPDSKTAGARADTMRNKLKPMFGGWDYWVKSEVGGNDLMFQVKIR